MSHTPNYGNSQNPTLAPSRQGYDITRMDVIMWERAGAPQGPCPKCKTWIRVGLDRCCEGKKDA